MARLPTMADTARALPFASYSKRDGFDWWRPESADSYSADFARGKEYALALMEAEGPRGGSASALGSILVAMVERGDATHRGLLLGFASVFADLAACAMSAGVSPVKLAAHYAKQERHAAAVIAAIGAGDNVVPIGATPRSEP